ncbi:hypothetical protein WR25_12424 isoform A [Diploscapter pachys]|uniref:Uncharacterized protein n=3 Tax=Diploscapter pachys TaxID=2018661 RepID=A0A2A2J4U0_9BILA|nr:hypothetical protein WR25_12424 isoform A [Diploscapter pachys]
MHPPTYLTYSAIFLFVQSIVADEVEGFRPDKPTNWTDEQAMRERMAKIAADKFSKGYTELNNLKLKTKQPISRHLLELKMRRTNRVEPEVESKSRDKRDAVIQEKEATVIRAKRDGGIVSGPVATAIVTGMIGMTAKTVSDLTSFHPQVSQGGCTWFGTAPLCNFPCPADFDLIREHNGRCSSRWLSGLCQPDESFGKPCTTIFGDYFTKRFCCKSDPTECTWSGRGVGANTAHNIYCRYDNVGRCGMLDCSINHYSFKGTNSTEITGDRCDHLELFGLKGKATCGYIVWFDEAGDVVNSWYKTSQGKLTNDG